MNDQEIQEIEENIYNDLSYMEQLDIALQFHMDALYGEDIDIKNDDIHSKCISEILNNVPERMLEDDVRGELKEIFLSIQMIDDIENC